MGGVFAALEGPIDVGALERRRGVRSGARGMDGVAAEVDGQGALPQALVVGGQEDAHQGVPEAGVPHDGAVRGHVGGPETVIGGGLPVEGDAQRLLGGEVLRPGHQRHGGRDGKQNQVGHPAPGPHRVTPRPSARRRPSPATRPTTAR